MTSTTGSTPLSAKAVRRAAVITHGKPQTIGPALARLTTVAREAGVELIVGPDEAEKHGVAPADGRSGGRRRRARARRRRDDAARARALPRHRRARDRRQLRPRRLPLLDPARPTSRRASRASSPASTAVEELPTLDVEVGDERRVAVNDLVVASALTGRMVELEWAVGGEVLGRLGVRRRHLLDALRLDGLQPLERRAGARLGASTRWRSRSSRRTRCTPGRSSCRAGRELIVWNRTAGRRRRRRSSTATRRRAAARAAVPSPRVGDRRSLLATLPEVTFFSRYRRTFAS